MGMTRFVADSPKLRLVPSQLHIYGRDAKINDIKSPITKMFFKGEVA